MRVYAKWGRVHDQQPLAYTRRILANVHTDWWRRRHHEVLTRSGDLPQKPSADGLAGSDDWDQAMRMLRELSPRERQVIVLRHYADLSEKDVAATLGISLGTVKSAAAHGLARLRAAYTGQEG